MKKIILSLFCLFLVSKSIGQNHSLKVYITISEECPISIAMVEEVKSLIEIFHEKVEFTLVFPMMVSDSTSANNFIAEYEFYRIKTMIKGANQFCKENKLTVTPETLVMSNDNKVVYKGRISNLYSIPGKKNHRVDKFELKEAIMAGLNNNEIRWQNAVGCAITYEN